MSMPRRCRTALRGNRAAVVATRQIGLSTDHRLSGGSIRGPLEGVWMPHIRQRRECSCPPCRGRSPPTVLSARTTLAPCAEPAVGCRPATGIIQSLGPSSAARDSDA